MGNSRRTYNLINILASLMQTQQAAEMVFWSLPTWNKRHSLNNILYSQHLYIQSEFVKQILDLLDARSYTDFWHQIFKPEWPVFVSEISRLYHEKGTVVILQIFTDNYTRP
jgi:hypothetical protein